MSSTSGNRFFAMHPLNEDLSPFVLKTDKGIIAVFAVLTILAFAVIVATGSGGREVYAMLALIFGPLLVHLAIHRITFFSDHLCYFSMLGKRDVFYEDIRQIELDQWYDRWQRKRVIWITESSSPKRLRINAILFTENDVQIALDTLARRAPQANWKGEFP